MSEFMNNFHHEDSGHDRKEDFHISDETLLSMVDGELSPAEASETQAHLEACWTCRTRQDLIRQAITDAGEYRKRALKPYLPLSVNGRSMFIARLEQRAIEFGHPSLWVRLVNALRRMNIQSSRPAIISATLLVALFLLLIFRVQRVSTVYADELLQKAQTAQANVLLPAAKSVVYQKLRIRMGNRSVVRSIYRDPQGKRQADQWEKPAGLQGNSVPALRVSTPPDDPFKHEVQEVFQLARLDWENPLSAEAFSAWRKRLSDREDRVESKDTGTLVLTTSTTDGPVREASLSVRSSDFHPVAEALETEKGLQVEIDEISFAVLNLDAINPALFEPSLPVEPPPSVTPRLAPPVSEAELAESELQTRAVLHRLGADLGEQVEVGRGPKDTITLSAVVSSEERKQSLLSTVHEIPHLKAEIQTYEEAAAREPAAPQNETPSLVVETRPLLDAELKNQFPDVNDRAAFVNKALAIAQDLTEHAFALRRLAQHYTPGELALLGPSSRRELDQIVQDHLSAMRQAVHQEQSTLATFLAGVSSVESSTELPPLDAFGAAPQLLSAAQSIHDEVTRLFAGAEADTTGREVHLENLSRTLTEMQKRLSTLKTETTVKTL
jgi:hypothetical protein